MTGKKSRNKGKRGERELAKELSRIFGVSCRRGQQYCGVEGQDVVGLDGVHVECKRTETLSVYKAMEQAKNDAGSGDVPVVFHRRNRNKWLAVVELDSLVELARRVVRLAEIEDEHTLDELRYWVPRPEEMSGWDDPCCPEEDRERIIRACAVHRVDVPGIHNQEREDT